MAKVKSGDGPVIIKKYANRRLYNTSCSSYITLDDLARMTREGVDFQVVDAKSGDDITHSILTQIIMEEEANGEHMLPVSFLRQLISMYGNSMQAMMPHYLEASMANFRRNQAKFQSAFQTGVGTGNPLSRMAETNMAMMRAATEAFMPRGGHDDGAVGGGDGDQSGKNASAQDDLKALREQMAAMQKRLDDMDS
ncbi:polyhydroxyalkanoate synthesis repressor PhaR [Pseudopontixanthobacter vadosimaris]|uniref:polyhydroxyalkanoate synthesis repressor PhaR n=1 Tax=Pseudopontixanthobacter vadosimaris TaxID=2726450 RepID=UPI0014767B26|nr:polyhydroxyalkanoate synthesis repressor PhaR [Pseudopontixanthobacter vadosimaris]